MKIGKLILLGILIISVSCGKDGTGRSDCAVDFGNNFDARESRYASDMHNTANSDGDYKSLEACLQRLDLTVNYLIYIDGLHTALNGDDGCSNEERSILESRITRRIQDLEEDIENLWNQSNCEDVYGGG